MIKHSVRIRKLGSHHYGRLWQEQRHNNIYLFITLSEVLSNMHLCVCPKDIVKSKIYTEKIGQHGLGDWDLVLIPAVRMCYLISLVVSILT